MQRYYLLNAVCTVLFICVIIFPGNGSNAISTVSIPAPTEYNNNNITTTEEPMTSPSTTIENDTVPLDTTPDSYTVLVNKDYGLPSTYIPDDLVEPNVDFSFSYKDEKRKLRKAAASALEKMFYDASLSNIYLCGVSGYRSYKRQLEIYNRSVSVRGIAATNLVSAKPGYSEHQSGLSIDISARNRGDVLDQYFGSTAEGKWISDNAYKYGFIIRYPDGKSNITGYSYEPWHIRYVGKKVAKIIHKHNWSLEEYFGLEAKYNSNKLDGVDVEDADNVKYSTPAPSTTPKTSATPTKTPKPSATPKPTKKPKATKTPVPTAAPTKKPVVTSAPVTPAPTKAPTPTPATTPEPTAAGTE